MKRWTATATGNTATCCSPTSLALQKREPIVRLPSFEREEEVAIPIDMRFDIARNANRYYQKYHKQRRAQGILQEQIALCGRRSPISNSWSLRWSWPPCPMRWRSGKSW
ncbi:MAG: NFACT family protein [Merdibacter sp.]